jgi:hypothetical protein
VTDSQASSQTTIPIIRDNELRLAKIRRQLEDTYRGLDLAHDEVRVCAEAARSHGQPELAHVLELAVSNRIYDQLKSLTRVIEKLGGSTDLSENEECQTQLSDGAQTGNG